MCPAVPTAVAADHATAREIASWWVAFYLTSMGSLYRRSLSERGYREQVEAVLAGNPTHDTTDVPALVLLDELTVWGTPATAHDQLQHWYTAGAEMPILTLPPDRTIAELDYMLEIMSPHP